MTEYNTMLTFYMLFSGIVTFGFVLVTMSKELKKTWHYIIAYIISLVGGCIILPTLIGYCIAIYIRNNKQSDNP